MGPKPEFLEHVTQRRAALHDELKTLLPPVEAICLELGCGHGHFLARYATDFPQKYCLGVDLRGDRVLRAKRKADRARLPRCHFIRAEALELIETLPPGITFAEVWVLFPDPWPKKRHHKNRLLQSGFFDLIASRAGEGTLLFFRTDHREYFQSVKSLIPKLNTWRLNPTAAWPLEHETVFQARAPIYYSLVAVRTSHPAIPA